MQNMLKLFERKDKMEWSIEELKVRYQKALSSRGPLITRRSLNVYPDFLQV